MRLCACGCGASIEHLQKRARYTFRCQIVAKKRRARDRKKAEKQADCATSAPESR